MSTENLKCGVCGAERPKNKIAEYHFDLGMQLGLPAGVINGTTYYCVDNSKCSADVHNVEEKVREEGTELFTGLSLDGDNEIITGEESGTGIQDQEAG